MQFDYAEQSYPPVDKSNHLKSDGNLQYLQLIDLIGYLWEKGHPDIKFVPAAAEGISDADKGYIVYGLEARSTTKDFAKARMTEIIRDPESGKDVEIWIQSFDNFISFAAVHRNPRIAEEIIEAFEDFMIESTGVFKRIGLADLFYSRRYPDREDARIGRDMCVRTVVYRAMIQKVRKVEHETIEQIVLDARVWFSDRIQVAPISTITSTTDSTSLNIIDELQHATPFQ